jgi:hypothetical protein
MPRQPPALAGGGALQRSETGRPLSTRFSAGPQQRRLRRDRVQRARSAARPARMAFSRRGAPVNRYAIAKQSIAVRALRESNLRLLQSVPRARWVECYGVHEVRGRQTVEEFVRLEAAHDLNHLRQIDRILGERRQ